MSKETLIAEGGIIDRYSHFKRRAISHFKQPKTEKLCLKTFQSLRMYSRAVSHFKQPKRAIGEM